MAKENADLLNETAATLLEAIKKAAPLAHDRSTEGLESLARAYALVADAALQTPREKGRVTMY